MFTLTPDEGEKGTYNLSWNHVECGSLDTDHSYEVYLDGEPVGNTKENSYVLRDVPAGDHIVAVAAKFEPAGVFSNQASTSLIVTSVKSVVVDGVSVQGLDGSIAISTTDKADVDVCNLSGRVMTSNEIHGSDCISVDAGVYVVVVRTGERTATFKVMVK